MSLFKKMAVYSAVIAPVTGVFTKVFNFKRAKHSIIKKVVLFVLFKLLQNSAELATWKFKCFFQNFWKRRVQSTWNSTIHKFTGATV